jgi:hypothetical protein
VLTWSLKPAPAGSSAWRRADLKIELAQMQGRETKTSVAPTADKSGSVQNAGRHKGAEMKDRILKLLASLRKLDAGRADELQKKVDGYAEDKLGDVLVEVSQAVTKPPKPRSPRGNRHRARRRWKLKEIRAALQESKKIASKNLVETKLSDSKLPAPADGAGARTPEGPRRHRDRSR